MDLLDYKARNFTPSPNYEKDGFASKCDKPLVIRFQHRCGKTQKTKDSFSFVLLFRRTLRGGEKEKQNAH